MAGGFGVVFEGVGELQGALDALVVRANAASRDAVLFTARALVAQAKRNSTGPARGFGPGMRAPGSDPGTGPGVKSGHHRNSIRIIQQGPVGRFGYEARVAPTMRYSRRLELGFDGTDSRGRTYHQQPYPYLYPAYRFVVSIVAVPAYERAWAAALRA